MSDEQNGGLVDKFWQFIWGMGRLVCPDCYRRLTDYDFDPEVGAPLWFCDHCENDMYKTEYIYYWPFGVLRLRFKRLLNRMKNN